MSSVRQALMLAPSTNANLAVAGKYSSCPTSFALSTAAKRACKERLLRLGRAYVKLLFVKPIFVQHRLTASTSARTASSVTSTLVLSVSPRGKARYVWQKKVFSSVHYTDALRRLKIAQRWRWTALGFVSIIVADSASTKGAYQQGKLKIGSHATRAKTIPCASPCWKTGICATIWRWLARVSAPSTRACSVLVVGLDATQAIAV